MQAPLSNYYEHLLCILSFDKTKVINENPIPFHFIDLTIYIIKIIVKMKDY